MTRGPAPKPTALKQLAGNPGKRPLNGSEPQYQVELPSAPRHLSKVAQREWRRVGKLLVGSGVMTAADRAVLALYCQAYARWVEAEEAIAAAARLPPDEDGAARSGLTATTPKGMVVQSVYLQIANKAMEQVKVYGAELGLTPASRTRIHVEQTEARKSLVEELFEGVASGRGG